LRSLPRTPALAAVTAGTVYGLTLRVDGRAYEIRAASTGVGFHGETTAAHGLFSCSRREPSCDRVAELKGGFGTTGDRMTFSVPIADLGVEDGSVISDIEAFTALGTVPAGAVEIVDEAHL
ncbi:MAG: hypothetical protein ACRDLB_06040, partial [Actinomycetota bacterium]